MSDFFQETLIGILTSPFFQGLFIGLCLALFIFVKDFIKLRNTKKETQKFKDHLQTKFELETDANVSLKQELDRLKSDNENLQTTVRSLSQKPDKQDLKQLYAFQRAIDLLLERNSGLIPTWQSTVKEAEEEVEKSQSGELPLLSKFSKHSFWERLKP
ncbi:MAG: hypothetical protein DWQ06_04985 [Calditrichaeota bacterium]|nr:MAG: hypothetical protein DWQ06_04985 [Calditrichota bacterium]